MKGCDFFQGEKKANSEKKIPQELFAISIKFGTKHFKVEQIQIFK